MTFDDDFIKIDSVYFGTILVTLEKAGLTWPPPELLIMADGNDDESIILMEPTKDDDKRFFFQRRRLSSLTDEQRSNITNIARGAEYRYLMTPDQAASSST